MAKAAQSTVEKEPLSHNLVGQRLGRKGRDTRARILTATEKLLADPGEAAISLSAVAREASIGMTTLYLYFSDLTELLLAVLLPIMESAEDSYVGHLRMLWPDKSLAEDCLKFVEAYYAFWVRHSRILHLRNTFADNNDERMRAYRTYGTQPVIGLLSKQMGTNAEAGDSRNSGMATVLLTGIERMITVMTDPAMVRIIGKDQTERVPILLKAEARLLELGIRDCRANSGGKARSPR
jgi:AcrR family transcriptional regulator